MPGNNNPWAGELASRNKKKNSVGRQTSQQGKSPNCASPPVQPVEEGKKEVFTSERTPLIPQSPPVPVEKPTNSTETEASLTRASDDLGRSAKENTAKVKSADNEAGRQLAPGSSRPVQAGQKVGEEDFDAVEISQQGNQEEKKKGNKTEQEKETNKVDSKTSKKESDWLKESRMNLKPVAQPFKVAEPSSVEVESPIEQLITSKGSAENKGEEVFYLERTVLLLPTCLFRVKRKRAV